MRYKMKLFVVFAALLHVCLSGTLRQNCPQGCGAVWDPVCGSDEKKTYSNQCMLTIASCNDPSISLAYNGECRPQTTTLPPCSAAIMCIMLYDPVCGSDGITYSNECLFHTQNCNSGINVAHKGPC